MTGWRMGWMIGPKALIDHVTISAWRCSMACRPSAARRDHCCRAGIGGSEIDARYLPARRDAAVARLNQVAGSVAMRPMPACS
jgi:aspartate/methionine/tyrosine aminotransferase